MTLAVVKNPAEMISPDLHRKLTAQLIREHAGMTGDEAVRIVNATVAFLVACAQNPGVELRPSKRVDLGWHMFILNTRDYAAFCNQWGAGFIHHIPDEFTPPRSTKAATAAALAPTVEALRAGGFDVDAELWATDAARCTQCHGGCTNCGQGGDDPRRCA